MTKPLIHFSSLLDRAAFEHLQNKTLLPSFSHYDVWLYEHSVGFTVAKMMDMDLLAETKSAVVSALENGTDFRDFKNRLKPYLMAKGWWGEQVMLDPVDGVAKTVQLGSTRRLRVIFQTNLATAYAAGQWARIQENKQMFPYLKYIASIAEHKRQSHMTYYGKIWAADDPIWQSIFPPNGYGCQCTVRQLTKKQALRERNEDINRQPERFTEQQKINAQNGVLDDGTDDIQWVDFTNPRTGQTVKIPFDVTPTFAHNHAARLDNLQDLAGEKYRETFKRKLSIDTTQYVDGKIEQHPISAMFNGKVSFAKMTEDEFILGDKTFLTKEELAQLSGAIDGSELTITERETSEFPVILRIKITNDEIYQKPAYQTLRLGHDGNLSLVIDLQKIKQEKQGQGISSFALRQQIRLAQSLGIDRLETFAIGDIDDPEHNGYYTWARLGFNADIPDSIRAKLPENLKQVEDIADLMLSTEGRSFWKQNGSDVALKFDLASGSKSIKILKTYLWEKFKANL